MEKGKYPVLKIMLIGVIVVAVVLVVIMVMPGIRSKVNKSNQEAGKQAASGLMTPVYSAMLVGLELAEKQGTLQDTCRNYLREFPKEASKVITTTEQGYEVNWNKLRSLAKGTE